MNGATVSDFACVMAKGRTASELARVRENLQVNLRMLLDVSVVKIRVVAVVAHKLVEFMTERRQRLQIIMLTLDVAGVSVLGARLATIRANAGFGAL